MKMLLSGLQSGGLRLDYHLADDRLRGLGGVLAENGDPGIPLVPPLPEKAGEEAVRHAPCGVQLLRGMAGEVVRGGAAPAGRPAFFRDAVGQQSEEGDGEGGDQRRARRERVRSFIGGSFLSSMGGKGLRKRAYCQPTSRWGRTERSMTSRAS